MYKGSSKDYKSKEQKIRYVLKGAINTPCRKYHQKPVPYAWKKKSWEGQDDQEVYQLREGGTFNF